MQTNTIFSVFVENLSELNEGNMVGCWVEFPCDYDEWKEVLAKECYTIPDELEPYIDWKGYADSLTVSGYTETSKGVLIEEY